MTAIERIVLFVPIVYLIMIVYVAPGQTEAREILRVAFRKSGKVLFWTGVIVASMLALEFVFLP